MKVTIIQKILPHYRIPLFKLLNSKLKEQGVELQVVYGQEYPGTVPKSCEVDEEWAVFIKNKYFFINNRLFVYQSCLNVIRNSNLVILEQANSLLLNYYFLLKRKIYKRPLVAYWGHGKNMQAGSGLTVSEILKNLILNQVDWWFAYTNVTKKIVAEHGVPKNKIVDLQNTVDTKFFKESLLNLKQDEIDRISQSLNLSKGYTGLYCGGMYDLKKLDFLIESSLEIKKKIPSFTLILIGDGPTQNIAEDAANKYKWVHYLGPKYGEDRALYFQVSDIFLMPGLVGLAIIDAFLAGLPLFTTSIPIHSPEIAYLRNGVNGFMSEFTIEGYTKQVVSYLENNNDYKAVIKNQCLHSADIYTLDNMATRFSEGILSCLAEVRK